VQLVPVAQIVGPVYPVPPHWPYFVCVGGPGLIGIGVGRGVGMGVGGGMGLYVELISPNLMFENVTVIGAPMTSRSAGVAPEVGQEPRATPAAEGELPAG